MLADEKFRAVTIASTLRLAMTKKCDDIRQLAKSSTFDKKERVGHDDVVKHPC